MLRNDRKCKYNLDISQKLNSVWQGLNTTYIIIFLNLSSRTLWKHTSFVFPSAGFYHLAPPSFPTPLSHTLPHPSLSPPPEPDYWPQWGAPYPLWPLPDRLRTHNNPHQLPTGKRPHSTGLVCCMRRRHSCCGKLLQWSLVIQCITWLIYSEIQQISPGSIVSKIKIWGVCQVSEWKFYIKILWLSNFVRSYNKISLLDIEMALYMYHRSCYSLTRLYYDYLVNTCCVFVVIIHVSLCNIHHKLIKNYVSIFQLVDVMLSVKFVVVI